MININSIWSSALDKLAVEMPSSVSFEVWIKNLEPVCVSDNKLVLAAYSASAARHIEKNYSEIIDTCVVSSSGMLTGAIVIFADDKEKYLSKQEETLDGQFLINEKETDAISSTFIKKYTFDSFVVGQSNNFAYSAALAASENSGEKYNPLFLYGGVGLGKTHLLHAIGNHIKEKNPRAKILYVPTEQFTNELITSIRNSKDKDMTVEFREKYRNVDVLMLDDVQFLSGKSGSQEALFHTFNDLYQSGKKIILSSDRPPKEIATLSERLRTRFEWGLIADIQAPDIETRIAILQKKAQQENYLVENEVIKFIAERVESNIREMEGLLAKVVFYAPLLGKTSVDINVAREALRDYVGAEAKSHLIDADLIIDTVCDFFKITKAELIGKKRNKEIVEPRMICIYLITEILNIPLQTIGDLMGGRDHTTIMNARDKIAEKVKTVKRIKDYVTDVENLIYQR